MTALLINAMDVETAPYSTATRMPLRFSAPFDSEVTILTRYFMRCFIESNIPKLGDRSNLFSPFCMSRSKLSAHIEGTGEEYPDREVL